VSRVLATAFTAAFLMAPALAGEIVIPVPGAGPADETVAYSCAGEAVSVRYVNAGPVSLAILTVDGELVVASNVPSASGARYAGGRFVWWSKGAEAALYDALAADDAAPLWECVAVPS
jgi:membrane-bound inhibitor of C-type lysozyme